jgi:hypothetical protein
MLAVEIDDHRTPHRVYQREVRETYTAPDGRIGHRDPLEVAHLQRRDNAV